MTTPLISIIIPNYNRENLIGETLDSILAQTYTHWECIIVDDGSTDNSKEVIQEYVDKEILISYNDESKIIDINYKNKYHPKIIANEYYEFFTELN